MALYDIVPKSTSVSDLTQAQALKVHDLLKAGVTETDIFCQLGFKIRFIIKVKNHAKDLETGIYQSVRDNPDITAVQLRNTIVSPVFDPTTFLTDVVAWSKDDPANPPTFAQFKSYVLNNS